MTSFPKKTLVILFAGVIFFLLDRFADVQTAFESVRFTYAYPFISCITVLFGPLVGGLAGILGLFIYFLLYHNFYIWIEMICVFLFCLFSGIYSCSRVNIRDGILDNKDIQIYNRGQFFSNLFIWIILRPAIYHYVSRGPGFLAVMKNGFVLTLNRSLSCMIIGSILLGILTGARYMEAGFYRS